MPSRRDFLAALGGATVTATAGCAAVPAPRPEMDVGVTNWRPDRLLVAVKFFDESTAEYSDALVHEERFDLPGWSEDDDADGDGNEAVRENALPDRTYRVAVLEHGSHHYHYRPDCGGPDDPRPGVMVTFAADGHVRFTQATCSDDEPFL